MPARADGFDVVRGGSELLVIAGGEKNAERRSERLERREQVVEIAFCAVKQVAGKKDNVGLKAGGHRNQSAAESDPVDGPEMQVAEQNGPASAPGRGQIGKLNGNAADANHCAH